MSGVIFSAINNGMSNTDSLVVIVLEDKIIITCHSVGMEVDVAANMGMDSNATTMSSNEILEELDKMGNIVHVGLTEGVV